MSEYLHLAENILFKNNKLTCINIYDEFKTVAMPAEFNFDMVVICGPNWKVGEHKINIKAVASNGAEVDLGEASINIPNENFVYNAYTNNIKITMDYSVSDLTFYVYDNGKEILSRKYPVVSMFIPQVQQEETSKPAKKEKSTKKPTTVKKETKPKTKTNKK